MTLTELLESMRRVAVELRRDGMNCCASRAENWALRLEEAIKETE